VPLYRDDVPLDDAIRVAFPDGDPASIRQMLAVGGDMSERVHLAVVLLSDGRLDRLQHFMLQAALDSRDVLYWAFYYEDEAPERLRHLLKPRA
jgi:hypothetical protein